jgi:hypothetical protein
LDHRFLRTESTDHKALVDLYSEFSQASDLATNEQVKSLLASLSVVVRGYTTPEGPSEADKDQAMRFFLTASNACAAEGIALRMEML